jgi:hypothetical protein
MLDMEDQRKIKDRPTDLQVLGVSTSGDPTSLEKYGRTWALRNLAAKAARDGHLPIILDKFLYAEKELPRTVTEFVRLLMKTANFVSLANLGLPCERFWSDTKALQKWTLGQPLPPELSPEIAQMLVTKTEEERLDMLANALHRDLLQLLDEVRLHRGPIWFEMADVINFERIIGKLTNPSPDTLSGFVWACFDNEIKQVLQNDQLPANKRKTALVDALNAIIKRGSLYNSVVFTDDSMLSPQTREIIKANPDGIDLFRLNRMLLQDAYQVELTSRKQRGKILFLIDDLHKMGDVCKFVVKFLLGDVGFRSQMARRNDLRAVFTYSRSPQTGQESDIAAISDFLSASSFADDVPLACFRDPTESQLACENLLLHWREQGQHEGKPKPLVLVRENKESVAYFMKLYRQTVNGVPSKLPAMSHIVECLAGLPGKSPFRAADDDDALRKTA